MRSLAIYHHWRELGQPRVYHCARCAASWRRTGEGASTCLLACVQAFESSASTLELVKVDGYLSGRPFEQTQPSSRDDELPPTAQRRGVLALNMPVLLSPLRVPATCQVFVNHQLFARCTDEKFHFTLPLSVLLQGMYVVRVLALGSEGHTLADVSSIFIVTRNASLAHLDW